MAEEGTDTAPVQESTEEGAKSDNVEVKAEENNAEVKIEEPPVEEVKSENNNAEVKTEGPPVEETKSENNNAEVKAEDTPIEDSSSKVEITEEPTSAAPEGDAKPSTDEEQPKPIVEEPNSSNGPQLNVIPDGSENTVITEIPSNDTTPNKPAETPKESEPKKDILDAAMESAKAKPPPAQPKPSTIVRDSEAPDLPPAANTIFILDLMKQKQERLRRKKKDDMILEMALKMKKEKEAAKRGKVPQSYSYGSGGFLGVGQLTKPPMGKSPQLHRKVTYRAINISQNDL